MLVDFQVLAEQVDAEMRVCARRPGSRRASLRLRDGRMVACRLVNVSAGGALIDVPDVDILPDEFNLVIESSEFEAACSVRHTRRLETVGTGGPQPVTRAGIMFMSNRLTALQRFG
ncbi:MAG: PilZ domain-containing protein [Hyphomicrobium sp.]